MCVVAHLRLVGIALSTQISQLFAWSEKFFRWVDISKREKTQWRGGGGVFGTMACQQPTSNSSIMREFLVHGFVFPEGN